MTRLIPNPIPRVSDQAAAQMWAARMSTEAFLESLRQQGADKLESIRLLRRVAGISLGEAKNQVHTSDTWKDRRVSDDAFHESVWQAVELLEEESKTAVA